MIYLIGSLRNRSVAEIANKIQLATGEEIFADWMTPGPRADDYLRDYIRQRGGGYREALNSYAAKHIFEFDKTHLDRCTKAILAMPAGRSAFSELGYVVGSGKPGFVLMDKEPKR